MPIIEVDIGDLSKLVGRKLDLLELEEAITFVKGEIDDVVDDRTVKIELKDINRPDLWSSEGIARELKGYFNIEIGIPKYNIESSQYSIIVDEDVRRIRPYIASAIVKDVDLSDFGLSSLIQLQEKVMLSFGRNRKKVAIGTHNLDLIEFPVRYTVANPDFKFVPLNHDKKMSLREILVNTDVGRKYKHLVEGFDKYPILIDNKGEVISFPPIINSNTIGRLTENSRNIFIDVTGTSLNDVLLALNVIVTALADRGGKIYSVNIICPDKKLSTPQLDIVSKEYDLNKIKKISGLNLDDQELTDLLRKKRMDARIDNNKIIVSFLNYRNDLISEYDIAEELLIAYGYNNIEPTVPNFYTKGGLTSYRKFIRSIREFMISIGAMEVYTPVLTSKETHNTIFKDANVINVVNPVSSRYNVVRSSLLPNILLVLKENKDISLPIDIFEVGRVAYRTNNFLEDINLIYLYLNSRVFFNDAKEVLEALFDYLKLNYTLKESKHPYLIKGRQADIYLDSVRIGWIGELNPEILDTLEVDIPIVGFEISLGKVYDTINKRK